jgi:hypothetical protein
MKDQFDILKAWAGTSAALAIQHLGLLKEGLSLTLIAITCIYTGFKAASEWRKLREKKKEGNE